ncbi:MAG TPA: hypothetical protein VMD31_09305, partial [Opitutaceae bacterium]|nr:hypothetical protein [Opitutaceae bacterium]
MTRETLRILLIDGDAERRARVRTLLGGIKSTDYPVDEAPTFEAGLRLAGAHRHAAILVGDRLEGA